MYHSCRGIYLSSSVRKGYISAVVEESEITAVGNKALETGTREVMEIREVGM